MTEGDVLTRCLREAYDRAIVEHGDVQLSFERFTDHVRLSVNKYLGEATSVDSVAEFVRALHTTDLYLAAGCADRSEPAWLRFRSAYGKYLRDAVRYVCASNDQAQELADAILVHIFLPDRTGRSRIGSYDGLSSLATWLRVVINHQATNERERKFNAIVERPGTIPSLPDTSALREVEVSLRAGRYARAICDALRHVCARLQPHERILLLWRYDQALQLGHIGRLLGVHQSTVTRQIERILQRLRREVIDFLGTRCSLGPAAIEECLLDLMENPCHSILLYVRDGADPDQLKRSMLLAAKAPGREHKARKTPAQKSADILPPPLCPEKELNRKLQSVQ
jgi:RNA polymerase sigma-70 factor